ncbi:helix-turn-helix domain-containing protein [Collinsella provencensis]|uniref:helix-turn-helix domain-containing protein n=1 Tax=Collinsella provencensis TaxID=1937461 RepID=UPI000C850D62|nr:LexA family transcriptional regulator [Collinsella provencensis]
MGVGDNIRELRKLSGLSQEAFAGRLGVTKETVCRWERGRCAVKPRILERMQSMFNVSYDALVSDEMGLAVATANASIEGEQRIAGSTDAERGGSAALSVYRIRQSAGAKRLIRSAEAELPPSVLAKHPDSFFVRMEGSAMSRSYPSGSLLLIDPSLRPWNGCTVLAIADNADIVIRRYSSGNNMIILSSYSYETSEPDLLLAKRRIRVLGVVVWLQASHDITA